MWARNVHQGSDKNLRPQGADILAGTQSKSTVITLMARSMVISVEKSAEGKGIINFLWVVNAMAFVTHITGAALQEAGNWECWDWEDGWRRVHGHRDTLSPTRERHLITSSGATGEGPVREPPAGSWVFARGRAELPVREQGCWSERALNESHGKRAVFQITQFHSLNVQAIPSSWKRVSSRL